MNRYLIIALLLVNFSCMSQSNSDKDILERLYQAKLVSSRERSELLKDIKQREDHVKKNKLEVYDNSEERAMPHYPLQVLRRAKIYGTPGTLSLMIFDPGIRDIKKGKEKQVIDELMAFNDKLLKTKLISAATFNELSQLIKARELDWEYNVAEAALLSTEKEYFLAPGKLKKFAQSLLDRQLIEKRKFDELMDRSGKGDLRDYSDPLNYINGMVWIDLKDYSGKPEEYLYKLYYKAAQAFTGLSFDKLSYAVSKDNFWSKDDYSSYNITVTLDKGEKKYRYKSYWRSEGKNLPKEKYVDIPENFHEIFNRILADQSSPYRLHLVGAGENKSEGRIGILALTKKQFEDLQWRYDGQSESYINVSYENFTNKLTQSKIKEAIAFYESIGLLSHLQQKDKDSAIAEIEAAEINYYSDILRHFKDLVFEIDLEYGIDKKQYEQLTKMLAGISKGAFKPTDIIDNYDVDKKQPFDYGFTLNGKQYKTKLTQEDDWLDPEFFTFIEKAMTEQDKKGKFYELYPSDGARLIYLTHAQAELLRNRKMIELSDSDVSD